MNINIPDILMRPLSQIAMDIAEESHRIALYNALREQRDRTEPSINAFEARVETPPQDAMGPLHGLPITVKDQIAVTGWARNFGLDSPARRPDRIDAGVIKKFASLGARVSGKTALAPNAMDFQTYNRRRGHTNNPHDQRFTAGGSSGGGAAAVASGMSLLDLGADLAGSLRLPAAWCGVTSLTPTEGVWPNDGMLRGTHRLEHFGRIGPIARRVDDLAFIWQCAMGAKETLEKPASPLRIDIWAPDKTPLCDEATQAAWTGLARRCHQTGLTVNPDPMQSLFTHQIYQLFGEIMGHETGALIPAPIRWLMRQGRGSAQRSPGFLTHVHTGYRRDRGRFAENIQLLEMLRSEALTHWSDLDALILPVSGVCAFEHLAPKTDRTGVRDYDHPFDTTAGQLGYFDALTRFTVPITLLGWPVVTMPIGRDPNGIPMGAQIVGKPHTEAQLLNLSQKLAPHFDFK